MPANMVDKNWASSYAFEKYEWFSKNFTADLIILSAKLMPENQTAKFEWALKKKKKQDCSTPVQLCTTLTSTCPWSATSLCCFQGLWKLLGSLYFFEGLVRCPWNCLPSPLSARKQKSFITLPRNLRMFFCVCLCGENRRWQLGEEGC